MRLWLLAATGAIGCTSHGSQREPIGDSHEAAGCPTYLDLAFVAKDSRFDPGWTGTTHGVGLAAGSRMSVKIDECDAECRRCKFHGPVRGDPVKTPVINQRCLQKTSRICAADGDCDGDGGSDGPCRFVFPPIASTIPNTCTLAYFEPFSGGDPVQGVIDLATGEADMPVLNILLSLSLGACIDCVDDPTTNDGIAGGKCVGTNDACDLNGTGTAVPSATSFDCAPQPGISTIVLGTNGTSTSSVVWTMDSTRPMCTAMSAKTMPCWCGVCPSGAPCIADKDCGTAKCGAPNPPGNTMIPWNVANNSCPGKCNWDPQKQRGTCAGTGVSCFPDGGQMVATGGTEVHKDQLISQLANLVCMPSFNTGTTNGLFVDAVGGFPGPFLFEARFLVETRFGP